jgi:prepilin-type N-terminal cleavage/methylation domain-containing protein/prepilin-type processing-associated H-X9-DG protein
MKILKKNRKSAFTLIELLVVVAIIALLISILLPSLSKARDTARMVACNTLLKQYGAAHHMYANEMDDWFVYHRLQNYGMIWARNIKYRNLMDMRPGWNYNEYLGLVCPDVPDQMPDGRNRGNISKNFGGNATGVPVEQLQYDRRMRHETDKASGVHNGVRMLRTKVRFAANKHQMHDASDWNTSHWGARPGYWEAAPEVAGSGQWGKTSARHFETANFLHFDGHAANKTQAEYYPGWGARVRMWMPYRNQ